MKDHTPSPDPTNREPASTHRVGDRPSSLQARAGSVEPAVPEGEAVERTVDRRVLEVSDSVDRASDLGGRVVVECVFFRLNPRTAARVRPWREALRYEPAYGGCLGRGNQMVSALCAEAVRLCERLVEVPQVDRRWDRCQLVDDDVGRRFSNRVLDGVAVQCIEHLRRRTRGLEPPGTVDGPGCAGNLVPPHGQNLHQRRPDRSGRSRYEHAQCRSSAAGLLCVLPLGPIAERGVRTVRTVPDMAV